MIVPMPSVENSGLIFVYSTFPDRASAERVAHALVERKLAACVNIHGPMKSVYPWEGKIEAAEEFAAYIKTRRVLASDVVTAATPLHPYSVPCFLVLPIAAGNPDYLAWVQREMEQP